MYVKAKKNGWTHVKFNIVMKLKLQILIHIHALKILWLGGPKTLATEDWAT